MTQAISAIQSNILTVRADLAINGSDINEAVVGRNLTRLADAVDDLCACVVDLAAEMDRLKGRV